MSHTLTNNSTSNSQSGFTIAELIIAIAVGAIFATILSLILIDQARLSQQGRDITLANSYAETRIETLRSAGYLNLTNGSTDITSDLPSELKPPRSGILTISDYATGIKQIDLSITYNDQGTQRTSNYKTLVGELGVGQY